MCRHHNLKVPEVKGISLQTISVENDKAYCSDTIRILTDQIFQLSKQHSVLKEDNDNLRQLVNKKSDAISKMLTYNRDATKINGNNKSNDRPKPCSPSKAIYCQF